MKALSDENRLALLLAVADRPRAVIELSEATGLGQTLVSHHLKTLRETGLVSVTAAGPQQRVLRLLRRHRRAHRAARDTRDPAAATHSDGSLT